MLFDKFQVHHRLGAEHTGNSANFFVENGQEVVVVLAHDLGENVVGACSQHDVVDGVDVGEPGGDLGDVPEQRIPTMA